MKRIVKLILLPLLILSLAGCTPAAEPEQATVFAMNTVMTLSVYGEGAEAALVQAIEELGRLEGLFSVTRPDSDIARINGGRGEAITVSTETAALIEEAVALWEETGGAFSPALYPVLRAWGFTTGENQAPCDDLLAELLRYTNPGEILQNGNQITLPPEMELDLGGIAKGYVGHILGERMAQLGIDSAIFALGGDVYTVGARPGGGPWRVAIRDPFGHGDIGVVAVIDQAVYTSGSYERYFIGEDGQIYHHILDPATGRPADSGLVSVTVVTGDGARGDALATALFVMGLTEGADFVARQENLEVIFLTTEGRIYVTEGLRDRFTPRDGLEINWI